ncbi:MAG: hypothetical protein MHM6MM_008140 [Cercozoa sp. M6MM]
MPQATDRRNLVVLQIAFRDFLYSNLKCRLAPDQRNVLAGHFFDLFALLVPNLNEVAPPISEASAAVFDDFIHSFGANLHHLQLVLQQTENPEIEPVLSGDLLAESSNFSRDGLSARAAAVTTAGSSSQNDCENNTEQESLKSDTLFHELETHFHDICGELQRMVRSILVTALYPIRFDMFILNLISNRFRMKKT